MFNCNFYDMVKYFLFVILVFFVSINSSAQQNPELFKDSLYNGTVGINNVWRQVKISDDFYSKNSQGGYMYAIEGYLIGYDYNTNYPELNYKLGACYLNSVYKPNALFFLKRAYAQKPNVTDDILIALGLAYQYNYEFDSALMYFDLFKNNASDTLLSQKQNFLQTKIDECEYAKILVQNPVNVDIINFSEINTEYSEYCPIINADQSKIYFTARRPDCVGSAFDVNDGQYYEDIYFSEFVDSSWLQSQNIGIPLNSRKHDATVALSPDGNSMIIYRAGDLYLCNKKGDKWSYPYYLENINTEEVENSACFSFDGKTIFFVRGKTDDPATTNSDIYMSKFTGNQWGTPERLPDIINTPKDEDGVFLHPDGRTLYFSSMGHKTMGGFDIFKSTRDAQGNWSEPVNVGFPINTPDDDVYFVMSADGKTAYYSSVRKDSKGFSDIYKIVFVPDKQVFLDAEDNLIASDDSSVVQLSVKQDIQTVYLTLVTGAVYDAISNAPLEAEIVIFDNATDSLILTTTSEPDDGKYIVTLPSGTNYGMNVKADGYLFHSENFDLPDDQAFNRIFLDIPMYSITTGSKVVLRNIFFDFDKAVLRDESVPELERVVTFLLAYPTVKIEVSGHTDNRGTHAYNENLSEMRAKAVVNYFISKGIDANRLTYRGAAYDEPIADNSTDDGRQLNRRVEFKIIAN